MTDPSPPLPAQAPRPLTFTDLKQEIEALKFGEVTVTVQDGKLLEFKIMRRRRT